MARSNMTILPVSGGWCHWDTGIGNGTQRVPITAPMTRNSRPVCWCFRHNPDTWNLTLNDCSNGIVQGVRAQHKTLVGVHQEQPELPQEALLQAVKRILGVRGPG